MNYIEILQDSDFKVYYTQSGKILRVANDDNSTCIIDKIKKEEFHSTENLQLMKPHKLRKLAILLNNTCNLRCRYCYMDYGKILGERASISINLDNLRIGLENIFRQYKEGIEYIQFFGGEPLLDFEKLESIVNMVGQLCEDKHLGCPKYGIVTNGLTLTEDMIRIINLNNISVTISVDGPKEIHDKVRVNAAGCGSFEKVKNIVKQYQHKMKNPFIYELTINREHAKQYTNGVIKNWMNELKGIGFQVGIICLVENSKDPSLNITEKEIPILEKIYQEIADYFIDELILGREDIMVNAQIIEIIKNISKGKCEHRTCGPGFAQLTFTADGRVVPCTYMLDVKYRLGDFSSETWQSKAAVDIVKHEFRSNCKECWADNICNNFCYVREDNLLYESRYISPKCLANLLLIKQVLKRIVMLQREGKIAKINEGIKRCNKVLGGYNVK